MFEPRLYRSGMNRERFRFFPSVHLESDLVIGVPHKDFSEEMPHLVHHEQVRLHDLILHHASKDPRFRESLDPLPLNEENPDLPEEVTEMLRCGLRTGTGPMSSVAGLFAASVIRVLDERFSAGELVVENGGDLAVRIGSELLTEVQAGGSPFSGKLALVIPPGSWGICTSSGTHGHSFSRGKADAVTVVAESPPIADAWATSLAGRVQGPADVEPLLEEISHIKEIISVVVIAGEKMGIRGGIELKPLY